MKSPEKRGLEKIIGKYPTNWTTHGPKGHKNLKREKDINLLSHPLKDGKCPDWSKSN